MCSYRDQMTLLKSGAVFRKQRLDENTVKHRDGGVGSVVANHRSGGQSSVVVTTLVIKADTNDN